MPCQFPDQDGLGDFALSYMKGGMAGVWADQVADLDMGMMACRKLELVCQGDWLVDKYISEFQTHAP
jgi:hypothetical protein